MEFKAKPGYEFKSEEPARPLTDRECARILGSVIGGLAQTSGLEAARSAVRWWSENDEPWEQLKRIGIV